MPSLPLKPVMGSGKKQLWIGGLGLGQWYTSHGFELVWDLQQFNALKSTEPDEIHSGEPRTLASVIERGVSVIYQWHWHSKEVPAD